LIIPAHGHSNFVIQIFPVIVPANFNFAKVHMLTQLITDWATRVVDTGGYSGAAVLMALESMIFPLPSEAVMPVVGILVHKGSMNLWLALAATSAGSLIGSLLSYWLGYIGGKPLVMKVGRYAFLNEHHLDLTVAFFHRRGGITVFLGRFIPVVRHFISIPAGIGKMPLPSFIAFTLIGATLWNSFLLYIGYQFQDHIEQLKKYNSVLDVLAVLAIVGVIVAWIILHRKSRPAVR
jgi:membrane protein DedA with SNARE-associated domain